MGGRGLGGGGVGGGGRDPVHAAVVQPEIAEQSVILAISMPWLIGSMKIDILRYICRLFYSTVTVNLSFFFSFNVGPCVQTYPIVNVMLHYLHIVISKGSA